jgi:hypothetical protein
MTLQGIDTVAKESLRSFYNDISSEWCGREREMVSLYAFGHLVKCCRPGTVLQDSAQIDIEVAVRQVPKDKDHQLRRSDVCKELVIWPLANMTLWKQSQPSPEPLAIMEWRVNHPFNGPVHQKNRQAYLVDIEWLRQKSDIVPTFNWIRCFCRRYRLPEDHCLPQSSERRH